jgi:predicted DNA-binding protein (UPF0251 family)
MSAAVPLAVVRISTQPLPTLWATVGAAQRKPIAAAITLMRQVAPTPVEQERELDKPVVTYAFYRKHTESLLRRYLYASIQVGRSPALLGESIGRGWVSSRRVRTFEDAVIFVLDIERCLQKLSLLDRQLISRIVLQEYTHAETASLMGISQRTVGVKFPEAIDRLTVKLLKSELLILPD